MRRPYWILALLLSSFVWTQTSWAQAKQSTSIANEARGEVLTILKKLETVEPFRCKSITTSTISQPDKPAIQAEAITQIWQKGPYWRSEHLSPEKGGLSVNRPEGLYLYNDITKTFTRFPDFAKATLLQAFKLPPNESTGIEQIWSDVLDSPDLKVLETEMLDGKEATGISYTTSPYGVGHNEIKLWLWNENGLSLRKEETVSREGKILRTTRTEWKEFLFEDLPDSLFDVPQEQVQKLPEDWHP